MSQILEATAVVKAKDATGGTFEAIAAKARKLSSVLASMGKDIDHQIAKANKAANIAAAPRFNNPGGLGGPGFRNTIARARDAANAITAYEGAKATRAIASNTVKAAAEGAHERTRMEVSGMTPPEMKEAEHLSAVLSTKYKSLSQTSIMHSVRNIRSVVGHFEEATKILDPLLRLRVIAEGAHPERKAELAADFDKLVKAMEIKSATQDPAKFTHYMDGMAKALNVFGDTLRPTDYYEMFKYGRAATLALSDDFMLGTAPTLAQELGGNSAGVALSSFYTQFVSGKMSNIAVKTLDSLGLIDPTKVEKTTTGAIKGVHPGGVKGAEYLTPGQTDPYLWVNKILIPALNAKGITDPAQQQQMIAALASKSTTAQMLAIFASQQARIEKDRDLVLGKPGHPGAKGLEAADTFMQKDPYTIWTGVKEQLTNLLQAASDPLMPAAAAGMNAIAGGLSSLTSWARENPLSAAGALGATTATLGAVTLKAGKMAVEGAANLIRGPGAAGEAAAPMSKVGMFHASTQAGVRAIGLNALLPATMIAQQSDLLTTAPGGRNWADVIANRGGRNEFDPTPKRLPFTIGDIATRLDGNTSAPAKLEGSASLETKITVEPSPDFLVKIQTLITNGINSLRVNGAPPTGTAGSTGSSMPEAGATP
jgi:hypothetical protein